MAEEENEKGAEKGKKPELTPEQEAEIAAKKAARAEVVNYQWTAQPFRHPAFAFCARV